MGDSSAFRVLIVEDNRDSADSLAKLLEVYAYEVQVAYDGREGYTRACAFQPDAILVDIGLPYMSGLKLAEEIRRTTHLKNTFLVAVTAHAKPEIEKMAGYFGIDEFCTKPCHLNEILCLLEQRKGQSGKE